MIAAQITTLSLSGVGLAFRRRPVVVRVAVRAAPSAGVPFVHLRRRGGAPGQRATTTVVDLAAVRRRVHRGVRGDGRRRRGRRPTAHPLSQRTDHRRRRVHRRQRLRGGRRHPSAQAGHEDDAPARGRRRRLSYRSRPGHRLDAVRRLRPRRHPHDGGLQPECRVGLAAAARLFGRPRACRSSSPLWPSTG